MVVAGRFFHGLVPLAVDLCLGDVVVNVKTFENDLLAFDVSVLFSISGVSIGGFVKIPALLNFNAVLDGDLRED